MNIKLENVEDCKGYWTLLNIFAYGTYEDYRSMDFIVILYASINIFADQAESLPTLTKVQDTKLKQLTLVSLASKNKVCIANYVFAQYSPLIDNPLRYPFK